jgi:hypothetical protein
MTEAGTRKNNRGHHDLDAISDDYQAVKSDFGALLKHIKSGALTRQVGEKPLASLLVAFGVGFIVSRIVLR